MNVFIKKKVLFWLMILALFLFFLSTSLANENIEGIINKYYKDYNFSGSILIAVHGELMVKKGIGMANYETKIPNKPNTIFRLASVSKQFTAMCIMMLEERGLLNAGDSIDKYIHDYPNGNQITIHNLLTHTSGIAEYTDSNVYYHSEHYFSPEDIINFFKDQPLRFSPGTKFEYCNSNYVLLGYIIEKVSHMKYEDFVKENIFIPLQMENSGYDHNELSSNIAVGYSKIYGGNNNNFEASRYIDRSIAYAAGALKSTVEDLYKWDQALYTQKLVKYETLNKMFTPYLESYGYGWQIVKQGDKPIIKHRGGTFGFNTVIYRDTQSKKTIIILCNNESFKIPAMLNELISALDDGIQIK